MIPNEIMEGLARIRIAGEQRQVLDVILRKTYGFRKPSDKIALSQFCLATGLSKVSVSKAIKNLVVKNIITKKGNGNSSTYSCHEDFGSWQALPKKVTLPKKVKPFTKKGKKLLPKKRNTKESTDTKETLTKESTSSKQKKAPRKGTPNPNVKVFIDAFYQAHKHVTGKPYKVKAQDGKLIKDLLGVYTIDELNVFAREYFTTADKFVTQQAGYSIGIFSAVIPKLIIATKDDDTSWMQRVKDQEAQDERE